MRLVYLLHPQTDTRFVFKPKKKPSRKRKSKPQTDTRFVFKLFLVQDLTSLLSQTDTRFVFKPVNLTDTELERLNSNRHKICI